jgi:hypothetical protein
MTHPLLGIVGIELHEGHNAIEKLFFLIDVKQLSGKITTCRLGFREIPVMTAMIEVQILIPLSDNAGVPFPSVHHDPFEQELLRLFGASSKLPGVVAGQWTSSGQVYRDDTRVYVVAVDGIIAKGDALRSAVTFAKAHYVQLAIYVRYLGISEIL